MCRALGRQLANIMEHLAAKEAAVSPGLQLKPGRGKRIEIHTLEWTQATIWFCLEKMAQQS